MTILAKNLKLQAKAEKDIKRREVHVLIEILFASLPRDEMGSADEVMPSRRQCLADEFFPSIQLLLVMIHSTHPALFPCQPSCSQMPHCFIVACFILSYFVAPLFIYGQFLLFPFST